MSNGFAIVIVAIATAGYILASECLLNRYKIARQSGHRLYLSSLKFGMYALFPALVLFGIISLVVSSLSPSIAIAALTVITAIAFTEVYNRNLQMAHFKRIIEIIKNAPRQSLETTYKQILSEVPIDSTRQSLALWKAWQENDIEQICAYALTEFKPVAVTLDSKKVYVGMVVDTIEPSDQESHLSILPLYSGYRDDNQDFKLNRRYRTLIRRLLGSSENKIDNALDYAIALPVERIVTIHIFNEELYQEVSGDSIADIARKPAVGASQE